MEGIVTLFDSSNWDFLTKSYVDYLGDWFLMSSPIPSALILSAYLLFVLKIGPAYMKDKPAYNLTTVLRIHNLVQTLLSCYMVAYGLGIFIKHGFLESQCLLENEEYTYTIVTGGYLYTMAKLTELLDTIFFVFRKKRNQISFLHVYHHSIMFVLSWCTLKYFPSFLFAFMGTLNSFVHVIMYAYYGLSTFPELAPYLWWKKYITKLQLIQFFMIFVSLIINYSTSKCPQTKITLYFAWAHCLLFIYLFSKFYIDNYKKNKKNLEDLTKANAKLEAELAVRNQKLQGKSL